MAAPAISGLSHLALLTIIVIAPNLLALFVIGLLCFLELQTLRVYLMTYQNRCLAHDGRRVSYEYLNSGGQKIHIRPDKPASFGDPSGVGSQVWHLNAGRAFQNRTSGV
jgi:hypothetical protein